MASLARTVAILEHEKLELNSDAVVESLVARFAEHPLESLARIRRKWRATRQADVTDEARGGRRLPGQNGKRTRIRSQEQVALGRAGQAFDRRPVKPRARFQRALEAASGDGQAF